MKLEKIERFLEKFLHYYVIVLLIILPSVLSIILFYENRLEWYIYAVFCFSGINFILLLYYHDSIIDQEVN